MQEPFWNMAMKHFNNQVVADPSNYKSLAEGLVPDFLQTLKDRL
jgi:hypothetical protein